MGFNQMGLVKIRQPQESNENTRIKIKPNQAKYSNRDAKCL